MLIWFGKKLKERNSRSKQSLLDDIAKLFNGAVDDTGKTKFAYDGKKVEVEIIDPVSSGRGIYKLVAPGYIAITFFGVPKFFKKPITLTLDNINNVKDIARRPMEIIFQSGFKEIMLEVDKIELRLFNPNLGSAPSIIDKLKKVLSEISQLEKVD